MARSEIAWAIHVVVQVRRMPDGSRKVARIAEVLSLKSTGGLGTERYRVRSIFELANSGIDESGRTRMELAWTGCVCGGGGEGGGVFSGRGEGSRCATGEGGEMFGLS